MNISDFISQMSPRGMARTNRYSINLTTPKTLNDYMPALPKIILFCDAINLPGLNINTAQIRTFGEMREMPYELNYDPIQVSFYVDGQMKIKDYFDRWINSIQRGETRALNYYYQYICPQMQIYVEDVQDKKTYEVELYEVYPKTVSPIQMGYEQKDIMKVQVTFMFKYWKSRMIQDINPANTGQDIFRGKSSEFDVKADFMKTQIAYNNILPENGTTYTGVTEEEFMFNDDNYFDEDLSGSSQTA